MYLIAVLIAKIVERVGHFITVLNALLHIIWIIINVIYAQLL